MRAHVADQDLHMGPEPGAVIELQKVGAFVGGHIVGHLEGRERQSPAVSDGRGFQADARLA